MFCPQEILSSKILLVDKKVMLVVVSYYNQ